MPDASLSYVRSMEFSRRDTARMPSAAHPSTEHYAQTRRANLCTQGCGKSLSRRIYPMWSGLIGSDVPPALLLNPTDSPTAVGSPPAL